MSRKPPGPPSLGSEDDDEGLELWNIIKSRIEPLKRRRERVHPTASVTPPASAKPAEKKQERERSSPRTAPEPRPLPPAPIKPAQPAQPSFEIERKKARRLAGGKMPIDAVLDLHGMRQQEAHAALVRFLHQSRARKLKFVKIITGKGTAGRYSGAGPDQAWSEPEPGVLRRQVPLWLAEPGLRELVVGTSTAGPRHGGSGALYVELRRRETKPG